jgi:glycosyltransferase involved in cell wall biosynthesis
MTKQIVFAKYGSFSLVNSRVEAILRAQFPSCHLQVVDVARDVLTHYRIESLWLRLYSSLSELPAFVRGRHSPWDFVFRHLRAWELIQRWIRQNIPPSETAFVFQTQGMFDASHPEVPFFIYTDHTRAAHKRQPGGGTPARVGKGWEASERKLYRKAATIFSLSKFCEDSLVEDYGIPRAKALTVSTGINIDMPRDLPDRSKTNPVILFVGVEWETKGGPELWNAFAKVRQRRSDAELWIVGAHPDLKSEGVRFFGRVDCKEMAQIFQEARLLCVPSRIERASMVALDAAAHGLPVISTPHGAGPERVQGGVTGLLIDPCNTDAFAEGILRLLDDPLLAAEMGKAGRRMVEESFTWEAVGKKIGDRIRLSIKPVS